jgi:membrane-associated phospholipid phosphatase
MYLAVTGLVLSRAPDTVGLAAIHLALLATIIWTGKTSGRVSRVVGDLLPLIAAPLLYAEIPALVGALGSLYRDSAIQSLEAAMFRGQPARQFSAAMPSLALSEILHAGYMTYYPAIFVPPLLLYLRRERHAFGETVLALTATYLVCWTIFAVFPVEGPRYLWGAAPSAPDGPMRRLANAVLAAGSSRGAAFPSSHMAVMVAQAVMAWRWQRGTGFVVAIVALLVGFGAVYGGFHYATDIVAGALLGAAVAGATLYWFSKEPELVPAVSSRPR